MLFLFYFILVPPSKPVVQLQPNKLEFCRGNTVNITCSAAPGDPAKNTLTFFNGSSIMKTVNGSTSGNISTTQGLEQTGMFSHLHNVEMSRRYRKDHDLFGYDADNFISDFDDLDEEDMLNYRYPAFSDIESIGVRGIYLGNFVRWDTYAQHKNMVKIYGYKGANFSRTFDTYDNADSFVYSDLHDILKLYKYGYSKVTDQACREIRFGRISKEQAKKIVSFYEVQEPKYIDQFSDWLGTNPQSLKFVLNRHRNSRYWHQLEPDIWKFKKNKKQKSKPLIRSLNYTNSKNITNHKYITIGKGVNWPKEKNKNKSSWL